MPRTHRRLIGVLVTLIGCIMATSCAAGGSTSSDANSAPEAGKAPTSIAGTWASDGDPKFEATITADNIEVHLVDGETKSLFWKGTFPASATEGATIQSEGDREALDSSMLGSSETTKPFQFTGDELTFEFSMMGTSTIVHTKKK